jgi:hypothetical protein
VGGFAVWKWLRRKPAPAAPAPDPADELRAKLAESRAVVEEQHEEAAGPETPVDEADPEARRRAVHDETRARIERLSARERGDAGG